MGKNRSKVKGVFHFLFEVVGLFREQIIEVNYAYQAQFNLIEACLSKSVLFEFSHIYLSIKSIAVTHIYLLSVYVCIYVCYILRAV